MSPTVIAIIAALLPAALLLFYIYRADKAQPEPASWLWKGVGYGVGSAILVIALFAVFPTPLALLPGFEGTAVGALIDAFGTAAIPEEGAKLLMLWLLLRKNPYFDEHLDGIVYATCIGLGFAGFENIFYLIDNLDSLVTIAVIRGLFSVPGHFFFAVAMGYFYSKAHFSTSAASSSRNILLAFIVPMILHGIFDALLMLTPLNEVVGVFCVIAFLYFNVKLHKRGRRYIKEMKESDQASQEEVAIPQEQSDTDNYDRG